MFHQLIVYAKLYDMYVEYDMRVTNWAKSIGVKSSYDCIVMDEDNAKYFRMLCRAERSLKYIRTNV